jgi:exodeoxyribonuclease-3
VPAGTQVENKAFPLAEIEAAGYQAVFSGQKTYNGVAILSKKPLLERGAMTSPALPTSRSASSPAPSTGVRIVCGYFPNGQAVGSEKFAYKLAWLEALTDWLRAELQVTPRLVLAGDYNVAPEDRDAHPDWKDEIHVSRPSATPSRP